MPWFASEIEFLPRHEQILGVTTIDRESGPGTILHDFDVMLEYVKERDLRVTGKHQLPLKSLPEINARLAHPLEHGLQRPQQRSFPHIHGLYLLVRASGLTHVDESGSKPFLLIDDEVYQVWQSLNPTERYGTLLEVWFLRGHADIIGDRSWPPFVIPENFQRSLSFFAGIPEEGMQIAGAKYAEERLRYYPEWHNLGLLDLFGLIDVQPAPPEPGESWRIERIHRTRFGDALLALLHTEFFGDFENIIELEDRGEALFGVLQPILRPYFPEWEDTLSLPGQVSRAGTHVFKVSLGSLWRRIAIPADRTMSTLASAILNAVEFDHDHLYEFSYRNRFGAMERVNHPYMDEGPWADEVFVGEVPIHVGQTMTYVFDFGDWWEFDVTLEKVDADLDVDEPVIVEAHGEPPEQYPMW